MKLLALILVITVAVAQAEEGKRLRGVSKKCIEEIDIDPEDVKKIRHADFSVKNEKSQCFLKCIYEKLQFFNEEGEFQPENMVNRIVDKFGADKDQVTELVEKCKEEKSDDLCEYSFNIYECFWTGMDSSPAKELEKVKAEKNAS